MPIVLTFDITGAVPPDHNRLQSMFQRLGWEHLGGTAYRYPRMAVQQNNQPIEDWFNEVVPALMLFRSYIIDAANRGVQLTKFSLDTQTSTGYHRVNAFGIAPRPAANGLMHPTNQPAFGLDNLVAWMNNTAWPYPGPTVP
jgi:hypothetical protein